jgi:hypothetical protein
MRNIKLGIGRNELRESQREKPRDERRGTDITGKKGEE